MKKRRISLMLVALAAVFAGIVGMSAFEAHVINVTAKIENALKVDAYSIDFGTVFPQEKLEKIFTVSLSQSFQDQARCSDVNLVQNGDFEEPVVGATERWDIFTAAEMPGWEIEWMPSVPATFNSVDRPEPKLELHRGVLGPAKSGQQYAELDTDWDGPASQGGGYLNNEPASVRIYQDIPTAPGKKYHLSFAFSPRPNTAANDNHLEVKWGGSVVAAIGPEPGAGAINWNVYEYEVTATGNTTRLEFADLGNANSTGIFLDDVKLFECGRVGAVDYVLRQKPKCVDDQDPTLHPPVTHNGDEFYCPEGSSMMPLLCPYLSKSEITEDGRKEENDGPAILPFHGPLTGWTMQDTLEHETYGKLSFLTGDLMDQWLIDLKVPCFKGFCAQDWEEFVKEANPDVLLADQWAQPIENEHEVFGCDLWLEVVGINGRN